MADFAAIVRNAISLANTLTTSLQATVTIYQWTGQDIFGTPTYATPITPKAIVEDRDELRQVSTGQTVRARSKITFLEQVTANGTAGREEPIDSRDKIILPDGATGPIIDIRGLIDPGTNKRFYGEVWLGVGGAA